MGDPFNPDELTLDGEGATVFEEVSPRARAGVQKGCLVVLNGDLQGRRFDLDRPLILIGRGEGVDIRIETDRFASRRHAEIHVGPDGCRVTDLESSNGMFVNLDRVTEATLRDGDRLQVGGTIFRFLRADDLERAWLDEMYRMATRDGLTEVFNKAYLVEALDAKLSLARRYRDSFAVLMVDVDRFKSVNDRFGHLAGDRVLKELAGRLQECVRQGDVLARFGGEEFVVVANNADESAALRLGERMRKSAEAGPFVEKEGAFTVTVSVGVCVVNGTSEGLTGESVIERADRALYQAKEGGRNCVRVWEEEGEKLGAESGKPKGEMR
ncbi:MAG: GGDEF domain-containing protein [Nitrospirae bacterium]|nr:GGDEF domain-containing protein [Nitrospirota bacterium]